MPRETGPPGRLIPTRPAGGDRRQLHAGADRSAGGARRAAAGVRGRLSPAETTPAGRGQRVPSRAMPIAIITGSGTHALPGFEDGESVSVKTPYGAAAVTRGRFAGADALHLSRHGAGHERLSNHVEPPRQRLGAQGARRHRRGRVHGLRRGRTRRSSSDRWSCSTTCTSSPTASRMVRCARSSTARATRARPLDPARRPVLGGDPSRIVRGRGAGRARGPRRRHLRARRRPALQHPGRDRAARRLRRRRGQPDGGAGDGPVRRARAAVRADRVRDRLCQRGQARAIRRRSPG